LATVRGRTIACLLGAALTLGLAVQVASAAEESADFQFQDSFSSSISNPGGNNGDIGTAGSGDKFVTETVGCKPQRVLSFPKDSGVQLYNPNEGVDVTFVLDFRLSDLTGYRRIYAPGGGPAPGTFNTDNGLYVHNSQLSAYDSTTPGYPFVSPDPDFAPNAYTEVAMSPPTDKGSLPWTFYVNGEPRIAYLANNSPQPVWWGRYLRFFKDNDSGGVTTEDSAGAVARIRIYDGSLSADEVAAIYNAGPLAGACNPLKRASAAVNGKVKVRGHRHGRLTVITGIDAACPVGGDACSGSAAVSRGGGSRRLAAVSKLPKKLGKSKLSVAAGKSTAVKVKLTRKASNALRSKGKLKAKIAVSLTAAGGTPAVASRTAKLKPPHQK
jgi:hypothetical protein